MILTKLEVLNLDLPIWRYKNLKSAFKTRISEPSYEYTVTDVWDPVVSRTRLSVRQNRGDGFDGAEHGEARRWRLLR